MVRRSAITLESECSPAERAALTSILTEANYQRPHLEIGTAAGGTLKELMSVYPDASKRPQFHVLDTMTYYPEQMSKVRQNLVSAGHDPDSVIFHIGRTQSELPKLRKQGIEFDFIFIDGDHRHYPVTVDLQWADLLAVGGSIGLHDDSDSFPGVGWAIERFLERTPGFEKVSQTETMTIVRKTGPAKAPAVTSWDLLVAKLTQYRRKYARSIRKRIGRGLPPK